MVSPVMGVKAITPVPERLWVVVSVATRPSALMSGRLLPLSSRILTDTAERALENSIFTSETTAGPDPADPAVKGCAKKALLNPALFAPARLVINATSSVITMLAPTPVRVTPDWVVVAEAVNGIVSPSSSTVSAVGVMEMVAVPLSCPAEMVTVGSGDWSAV